MLLLFNYFLKLSQEVRFILIGGFNTLNSLALFIVIYELFKQDLHYLLILVISGLISIFISYIMLRFFVFQSKGKFFKELLKCYLTYLGIIAFNAVLLYALVDLLYLSVLPSQLLANILVAFVSYFSHKHYSFRK
jgi:putative flippase GtrA